MYAMNNRRWIIRKSSFNLNRLLGSLLLLLIAFPYVQLIPVASYTQPFPLLLGALLFTLNFDAIWRLKFLDRAALLMLAAVGTALFLLTCIPYSDTQDYKYLLSYLSPLVLTIAILPFLERYPDLAIRLLRLSICIWFMVSAVQVLRDPTFATFMLGAWGQHSLDIVHSGRGVMGLAPEPTHHAFHILVLGAALALLDTSNRSRWLLMLCIVEAVVLAASSSAILVLGIAGVIWLLICRPRWIVLILIVAALAWSLNVSIDWFLRSGSRAHSLISEVLADPFSLMDIDYSLNIRLGGMAAVLMDAFDHGLIPRGMATQTWLDAREEILETSRWLMDLSLVGPPSGLGLLLFQGGILVVPSIVLMFHRMLSIRLGMLERVLVIAMPFVFLSQYYVSAPSFGLLYACAIYRVSCMRRTALTRDATPKPSSEILDISPPAPAAT